MTAEDNPSRSPDDDARRRIATRLGETLFVEAGAGTGKTRALVERVLGHVLDGTPLDRIVAITFTEKAAAELKERVRRALETHQAGNAQETERVAAALASLDRANISTIHAFALSLLYTYAAEAGIDPGFKVQDEVMAERRLQEQWRLYLEGLANDSAALAVFDRALSLGLETVDIERLAMDLVRRGELVEILERNPIRAPPVSWPNINGMLREMESLPLDLPPDDDKLLPKVTAVLNLVRQLAAEKTDPEPALVRAAALNLNLNVGRAGNWGGRESISRVREVTQRVGEQLVGLLDAARAEALADLLPYIVRFAREDLEARAREGLMTFDDLILRVRDLLRQDDGAVRSLRERFAVLLIDEFQDTDPLQVDIALAFATDPSTGALEPGRLFLVGDPKQSIYRFRRADMAVYAAAHERVVSARGRKELLVQNRRSRDVIVNWVNTVFEPLIGDGAVPSVQPRYERIEHSRGQALKGPGVAVFGEMMEGLNARQVRVLEAEHVAALCRQALEEGWEVQDQETMQVRPLSYRDIAILMPTRGVLLALERALSDALVPFRVEGGSLIYRTQETRDVINYLAAVDDPYDEIAIVAALRSPAFACSDVELAEFRSANRSFNYLSSALDGLPGHVPESLRKLAHFHGLRNRLPLSTLVHMIIEDGAFIEVGVLDRGDRNSFRRMRFMEEQARAFEAAGPESLRAFVSWLEDRAESAVKDHEGTALDDDEDAVRVLTVHGAKGLEFPVVVLCGLGSEPPPPSEVYAVDHRNGRVAVQVGVKRRNSLFVAGPKDELQTSEREHAAAEYRRVLYVAATRARDHLVVSLFHSARARECGARLLAQHGAEPAAQRIALRPTLVSTGQTSLEGLHVDAGPGGSLEQFETSRREAVEKARGVRYTSATALKDSKDATDDDTEPWSRGRGGTRLGRAVHAAIQSLSLDASEEEVRSFARAQAVAEAIPHREEEVVRLVRRALSSEAAARARAGRSLREVPFAMTVGGQVVEGFVDLLIETERGLEIVDWKTDQVGADEVPERVARYELQAGLYVLGISNATGRPVHQVTYVFVAPGVEESPGDPRDLANRAGLALRGAAAGAQARLFDD